jgi:hypothetical protein
METDKDFRTANYIVNMVKAVNKDLNYALSIVVWYSMNTDSDKKIAEYIKQIW